jgi:deazaflavin-dependent oxidoreductase (nitroreductase family)
VDSVIDLPDWTGVRAILSAPIDRGQARYARRLGRYSSIRGRSLTAYEQALERFAASRAGSWLFVHALNAIDRPLLAGTGGRVSVSAGAPVGLLESVGARTGRRRRTPLLYLADDDRLVLVASNGGRAEHPAWLHNLRRRPEVRFLSRERGWQAYRAREAAGADRDQCWKAATDLFAGYERYQRRAGGRTVPVVVLEPTATEPR